MAFTFETTTDGSLVRSILTEPRAWENMTGSSDPAVFKTDLPAGMTCVVAKDGDEVIGLVLLLPRNPACCECHVCMVSSSWGKQAWNAAPEFLPWLWANTSYVRAIGNVPATNRRALIYARRCGFRPWGKNQDGSWWGLAPTDEVWFGASRAVIGQSQQP